MDKKLRVGLLLDSVLLPAWGYTAIKRMVHSNCAEVALVILPQGQQTKSNSVLRTFWQEPKHLLYRSFDAIDRKLFVRRADALAQVDATEILSDLPVLEVKPVNVDDEQRFLASDVEEIRSHQLDILVKLGFEKLQGDILSAAHYGVWAYRWGDRRKIEDGLTGFWEVAGSWPETGAALQQLGVEPEHNRTLFESWFFTYPYSPARSRNYVLWAAASFLPRQVERLHHLGEEKFFLRRDPGHLDDTSASLKSNSIPSNLAVLWIALKLAARNLLQLYRRGFYREQWELLFHFGRDARTDISTFKKIHPSTEEFWADPHVIYQEPNYYIFVEAFPYCTKRGHISVIEMDQNGNCKQPIPILQKDWHLSFPYVFNWKGRYYMIPESSENRTIDLYEAVNFPYQWQHKMTLMKNVKAVDTTVVFRHEKWWLFTAIAEQEAAAPQVELFLFYSDDLFTDQWQAHPMNPIVSDVKRARGAGSVFLQDGKLFRPSQDCSKAYGYGFDLNEISVLSETEYCEGTITSVRPDPRKKMLATHTYARQGNLTVVDALTRRPKWAKPA